MKAALVYLDGKDVMITENGNWFTVNAEVLRAFRNAKKLEINFDTWGEERPEFIPVDDVRKLKYPGKIVPSIAAYAYLDESLKLTIVRRADWDSICRWHGDRTEQSLAQMNGRASAGMYGSGVIPAAEERKMRQENEAWSLSADFSQLGLCGLAASGVPTINAGDEITIAIEGTASTGTVQTADHYISEGWDIEILDIFGNYRHWKQWEDGGDIIEHKKGAEQ